MAIKPSAPLPYLGYGLGLRTEHYEALLAQPPQVQWLEIVSENYMVDGGLPLLWLPRTLSAGDARRIAVNRRHRPAR